MRPEVHWRASLRIEIDRLAWSSTEVAGLLEARKVDLFEQIPGDRSITSTPPYLATDATLTKGLRFIGWLLPEAWRLAWSCATAPLRESVERPSGDITSWTLRQRDLAARDPRDKNGPMAAPPVEPSNATSLLQRARAYPSRFIARTPWLRRRYARRLLRTIDKFEKKGRRLPESLARLEHQLQRIPKQKRLQTVEEMMEMSAQGEPEVNRTLRRAASRQDRQKGTRGGGVRPGLLPGQRRGPLR